MADPGGIDAARKRGTAGRWGRVSHDRRQSRPGSTHGLFPSPADPTKPCSRFVMQGWLQAAKRRALRAMANPDAREAMCITFQGVGFHAQKRYGVRAHRDIPPKVLESLARTKFQTLVDVYDYVDVEEMRPYLGRSGDPATETKQEPQARRGG